MKIAFLISTSLQYPHLLPIHEEAKRQDHTSFIGYNPFIGLECYKQIDLPVWNGKADVVVLADTGEARCFPKDRDYKLVNVHHGFADKGAHYWEEGIVNTDVQFCSGELVEDRFKECGAGRTEIVGEPKIDRFYNGFKTPIEPIDILWCPTFNNNLTSLFTLQDKIETLGEVTMKPHMAMWPSRRRTLKDLDEKITVLPETEYDIVPYILASKRVITDYSSAMFEAMLAGKEVYIFQPDNSDEYSHYAEKIYENLGVTFRTFDELKVKMAQPYPKIDRSELVKIHKFNDGNSAKRIVEICKELT